MNFKSKNEQLIELVVPASVASANAQIFFQNQPQLQSITNDKKIYVTAIETFSSEHLSGSPLTAGNPVATPAAILNATLTLCVAGKLSFRYMPLAILVRTWTQAGTTPHILELHRFDSLFQVDWTQSYVQVVGVPAAPPFSYLFNVHYCYDLPDTQ